MATNPGIVVLGNYSQLTSKDFDKVFFDSLAEYTPEFSAITSPEMTEEPYLQYGQLSGMGPQILTTEGGGTNWTAPVQGNSKKILWKKYTSGVQITEEMDDDDRTGHIAALPEELGYGAGYTRDILFWTLLNSGFVTTYNTGFDSLALFSASHTMIGGSGINPLYTGAATQSNTTSSGTALSRTTLQSALDVLETNVNESGYPMPLKPYLLVVPPALRWKAEELLKSEWKPESADNDINSISSLYSDLRYYVAHNLTSTTAWFLICKSHDLHLYIRKEVSTKAWEDPNTGNKLYKSSQRLLADFFYWKGVFGNSGA